MMELFRKLKAKILLIEEGLAMLEKGSTKIVNPRIKDIVKTKEIEKAS